MPCSFRTRPRGRNGRTTSSRPPRYNKEEAFGVGVRIGSFFTGRLPSIEKPWETGIFAKKKGLWTLSFRVDAVDLSKLAGLAIVDHHIKFAARVFTKRGDARA